MTLDAHALVIPALVTPVVLYAAVVAQRHAGPGAGGVVATFPTQLAISSLVVGFTLGDATAARLALAAATYLPAQVAYGLAVAAGMRRQGVSLALIAGFSAYAVVALPTSHLPAALACVAGVIAVGIGTRLHQAHTTVRPSGAGIVHPVAWLTVTVGTLVVLVVVVLVHVAGPRAGAIVSAVPAVSTTLAVALSRTQGRAVAAQTMAGLNRGLLSYFAFGVTLAVLATRITTMGASAIGLVVSGFVSLMAWRRVRTA